MLAIISVRHVQVLETVVVYLVLTLLIVFLIVAQTNVTVCQDMSKMMLLYVLLAQILYLDALYAVIKQYVSIVQVYLYSIT